MCPTLLATQRRFLDALLEPLSGPDRSLAELPAGTVAPSADFAATADALLRSTAEVSARERLGLYQRQYWFRLLDSLAEDFPRVRELLGAEAYQSAAERYLLAQPPACWTLRELGAGFAEFLRRDAGLDAGLRPWAAAVAEFEYAHLKVFAAATWPVPGEEDFRSARLTLQPAVVLVVTDRPVSRVLSGRPFRPTGSERPRRELQVVWRTADYALRSRREPLSLLPLLRSLERGGWLAAIITAARRLPAPAIIQAAFARWRNLGWLALAPRTTSLPAPAE